MRILAKKLPGEINLPPITPACLGVPTKIFIHSRLPAEDIKRCFEMPFFFLEILLRTQKNDDMRKNDHSYGVVSGGKDNNRKPSMFVIDDNINDDICEFGAEEN